MPPTPPYKTLLTIHTAVHVNSNLVPSVDYILPRVHTSVTHCLDVCDHKITFLRVTGHSYVHMPIIPQSKPFANVLGK